MKTKTNTNTNTNTVSKNLANAVAAAKALANAVEKVISKEKVLVTAKAECQSSQISLAAMLESLFDTKEEAAPVLKEAFEPHVASGAVTKATADSLRSSVLVLAFPVCSPKERDEAVKAFKAGKLTVEDTKAVARGNMKKTKKGDYVKVESAKPRQGGSNKKTPYQALEDAMTLAMSGKEFSKAVDAEQFAVLVCKVALQVYKGENAELLATFKKQLS